MGDGGTTVHPDLTDHLIPTWGAELAVDRVELRARYRAALQDLDADRDAVGGLLRFARS